MARITALGTVACVQPHTPPPPPQLAMWTDTGMAWQFFVVFNRLKSHNYRTCSNYNWIFFHNSVCQYTRPAAKTSDNNNDLIR